MSASGLARLTQPPSEETSALRLRRSTPLPQVEPAALRAAFERFELKYWVDEKTAQAAIRFAKPYLVPDPFGDERHRQRNTTLYLETPDRDFMRLHQEKATDRFKLRIRKYGDPPAGPAFFEIKRKVKNVIVKQRALVPGQDMCRLVEGDFLSLPWLPRVDHRHNLETFLYLMLLHRATPAVFVSCVREAYVAPDPEEDTRLTVDRDTVFQPARRTDFACDPTAWTAVSGAEWRADSSGGVIVELKFRGTAPWWMQELAQRLALEREGYSKYLSAMIRELDEDPVEGPAVSIWED